MLDRSIRGMGLGGAFVTLSTGLATGIRMFILRGNGTGHLLLSSTVISCS